MPIYNYVCTNCKHAKKRIVSMKDFVPEEKLECKKCGEQTLAFELSAELATVVYEMKDKYRGKQLPKGLEKQLKQRMNEHHDKYELEEKIDKYGMKDTLRHKWDKKIKKI